MILKMNDTHPTSSRSLAAVSPEDGGIRDMITDVRINPRYKGLIQAIGRAISESVVRSRRTVRNPDATDEYDYGEVPIRVTPRAGHSNIGVSVRLPFGWIDDGFERECYGADEAMHQITLSPDSNPLCFEYVPDPVEDELWRQHQDRAKAASEKELADRALAAAEALKDEWQIGDSGPYDDPSFDYAITKEIAAILLPFLQTKPKP